MDLNTPIKTNNGFKVKINTDIKNVSNHTISTNSILNNSENINFENFQQIVKLKNGCVIVDSIEKRNDIRCCDRIKGMFVIISNDNDIVSIFTLNGEDLCSNESWSEFVLNDYNIKVVYNNTILSQKQFNDTIKESVDNLEENLTNFNDDLMLKYLIAKL